MSGTWEARVKRLALTVDIDNPYTSEIWFVGTHSTESHAARATDKAIAQRDRYIFCFIPQKGNL